VNAPAPEDLILNLRDYPTWRITRNGTHLTPRIHRNDVLIALPIPAGPSTIDITHAQTFDRIIGNALSVTSFALLALFMRRRTPEVAIPENRTTEQPEKPTTDLKKSLSLSAVQKVRRNPKKPNNRTT
jgi:hypothetical protein